LKKLFWMVMALLIVAFTFSSALPAYAEDGNFAQAGQKVLELKEGVLNAKKAVIERSVQVFAEDRVITAEEVFALNTAIDDFNRTKENADRDLNFYGLKTSVVLNEALVKAVKVHYFDGHYLNKRDDGAVKTFFVRLTGDDVRVEGGMMIRGGEIFLIIIIAIIWIFGSIWSIVAYRNKREYGWGRLVGYVFFALSSIFILAFFL